MQISTFTRSHNLFDRIVTFLVLHMFGVLIFPYSHELSAGICLCSIFFIGKILFKTPKKLSIGGMPGLLIITYLLVDFFFVILRGYFIGTPPWGESFLTMMSYHIIVPNWYLAYLLPLVFFLNIQRFSLNLYLKIVPILSLLGILFFLFNYKEIAEASFNYTKYYDYSRHNDYFYSLGFALVIWPAIQKKQRTLIVLGCITLFVAVLFGRRGTTFSIILIFLSSFFLFIIQSKKALNKRVLILTLFSITIVGGYYFYQIKKDSLFSTMNERISVDSREYVNKSFVNDLFNSSDFILGRGINGQYYCPQTLFSRREQQEVTEIYRWEIETGLYKLILKGGLLFTILHLMILLGAFIKGFFYSRNLVVKAFSLWILQSLIELYPYGELKFNLKFFLIWCGVSICYNKVYRKMTDKEIKKAFNIQ